MIKIFPPYIPENFKIEYELLLQGHKYVAGVDEVGRGPLAGPIVFCAVLLDIEKMLEIFEQMSTNNDVISPWSLVNDSKKVSEKRREKLSPFLQKEVVNFQIIEYSPQEIDIVGLGPLTQKGFHQSVMSLKPAAHHVLTDGYAIKQFPAQVQTNIIKGDSKSITIAAASIIAKVYRDTLMNQLHDIYPLYGFNKHKGYGTKSHIQSIKDYGHCEIHRKSFVLH